MKIPAEFAPQSWEMPPGFVVLEESASVVSREFDGEKLDWLVALVEEPPLRNLHLWFRPLDARFDAGFIAFYPPDWGANGKRNWAKIRQSLPEMFDKRWETKYVIRTFYLNEEGKLRGKGEKQHEQIYIFLAGRAHWTIGKSIPNQFETVEFDWEKPASASEFQRLNALELWNQVECHLADSNSHVSVARWFAAMNERKRNALFFEQSHKSSKEMNVLLRALLINESIFEQVSQDGVLSFIVEHKENIYLSTGRQSLKIPKSLRVNLKQLMEWYQPVNINYVDHSFMELWMKLHFPKFSFYMNQPTAHEKLEASVRWREWKANHEKI